MRCVIVHYHELDNKEQHHKECHKESRCKESQMYCYAAALFPPASYCIGRLDRPWRGVKERGSVKCRYFWKRKFTETVEHTPTPLMGMGLF